jgi:hypothetical protein
MKEGGKVRELPHFFTGSPLHVIETRHINPHYTILVSVFGDELRMLLRLSSPASILQRLVHDHAA